MLCDICHRESDTAYTRPDGITRCKACADIEVYGRVITDAALHCASLGELRRWLCLWRSARMNADILTPLHFVVLLWQVDGPHR